MKFFLIISFVILFSERPRDIDIRVGSNKLSSGGTVYGTSKIIVHQNYSRLNYAYDVALLRVQTPIEFNAKVQPIMYSSRVIKPGMDLKATGWGVLSPNGRNPDDLQELYVRAISNAECAKEFETVHVSHLCTIVPFGKKAGSILDGDSGGPLVYKNELVGLTSFADPSVFFSFSKILIKGNVFIKK